MESWDKNASLLSQSDSDEEKKLKTMTPGVNVIKLFSFVAEDEVK